MMQKRKLSSLLLISFIVIFAFSYAAANEVTFETKDQVLRCDEGFQNITVSPTEEITGFEIVFVTATGGVEVDPLTVSWTAALPAGWYTDIDMSRVDGVAPDTVRMIALRLAPGLATLAAGDHDVATIAFTTNDVCTGTITMEGAEWTDYINPVGPIVTQFTALDASLLAVAVNDGTITVVNTDPTLAAISDATIHWGDTYTGTAVGDDGDLVNGCETLEYTLLTGPAGMTVDLTSGAISWTAPGSAVCTHAVEVQVADACGAIATTAFTICVENTAPEFTCTDALDEDPYVMCPDDLILVGAGEIAAGQVTADDADGGPLGLTFSVIGFDGAGTVVMDPNTGEFTWQTEMDYANPSNFVFELVVQVSDGANICEPCSPNNADTASYFIEVVPLRFYIEKVHDVGQGGFVDVSLNMPNDEYINHPMGAFEFLMSYDASALTLMGVNAGEFIGYAGWEYFTYRTGPFGNCGDGCPSGMIHVVAFAEYNNGPEHPEHFNNAAGIVELAKMNFLVSNDRTLECMYVPIRFVWLDCTDNTVSDVPGEHLFIGRRVYDYVGDGGVDTYVEITDPTVPFPSNYGPIAGCDEVTEEGKPEIYEYIDFFNGGVDIICAKDIDDRGDINMDGVAYSVSDAVMFTNYFIVGLSAFPDGLTDGSVAATDINADGLTLSVADLVYLVRIIVGDALPYDNPFQKLNVVEAQLNYSKTGVLSIADDVMMGAAHVTFEGNVVPQLLADDMELVFGFNGRTTEAMVWSRDGRTFTGDFLNADADVVSIEMATADGDAVLLNLVPTEFDLSQNYPNPFNPTTTFAFALPVAADYSISIYNVTGQVVDVINGSAAAGNVELEYDASNLASGIYFYKLNAGTFSETKKMVLLK